MKGTNLPASKQKALWSCFSKQLKEAATIGDPSIKIPKLQKLERNLRNDLLFSVLLPSFFPFLFRFMSITYSIATILLKWERIEITDDLFSEKLGSQENPDIIKTAFRNQPILVCSNILEVMKYLWCKFSSSLIRRGGIVYDDTGTDCL